MTPAGTQEQIAADIKKIRTDVDLILHGNGRRGVWALSDAVFGHRDKNEPGLVNRMKVIEDRHKEQTWLQRGIAIGVGIVALDSLLGIDLAGIARTLFSR